MMPKFHAVPIMLLTGTTICAICLPAHARAQEGLPISAPAMALDKALEQIERSTGTRIEYDPDAVPGKQSSKVDHAASSREAVRQALRGTGLALSVSADGIITVGNDIVVVARRDEAETKLVVNQASSSNRSGESLREQARSTTVISSKLMADQQAQDISDILKNAGGVTVVTSPQGGNSFTIRGFASNGIVNGLPGNTFSRYGASEPVANLERVEVLKGPDAILVGSGNLGGSVNLVTKKPSADPLLSVVLESGSYGSRKATVDASNALNESRTLSARFIAQARDDDRNFAGYRGTGEYVIAPSIRFKNRTSDIVLALSTTRQVSGVPPFALVGGNPYHVVNVPDGPIGPKDQGMSLDNTLISYQATRQVTDWLTLVSRGQIQLQSMVLSQYTLLGYADPGDPSLGVAITGDREKQTSNSKSIDTYVRITFAALGMSHKITAGGSYSRSRTSDYTSSGSTFDIVDIFNLPEIPALPRSSDLYNYSLRQRQTGIYAQDLIEFGPIHLSVAVRRNKFTSTITIPGNPPESDPTDRGYSPSFGVVYDLNKTLSIYANYVRGFDPSLSLQRDLTTLPSSKTSNIEAGIKAGFLEGRLELVGALFQIEQSNRAISDPNDPAYSIGVGGVRARGIDLDLRGNLTPEWSVQSAITYTDYRLQDVTEFETVPVALPSWKYSIFTGYETAFSEHASGGGSMGVYGQSRSYGDSLGAYRVPASWSIDANIYLNIDALRINAGVKNILDRSNYDVTSSPFYLPRSEPRTWRITASYSFY